MSFIHLNNHTEFSIVDSTIRIDNLVNFAVKNKQPAIAITDFCNLFGMVKFYQKAIASGIKPIIGCNILLERNQHISECILLCKNRVGLTNLSKVLSTAYIHNQKNEQPIISWTNLIANKENLILLNGGLNSEIAIMLKSNTSAIELKDSIQAYQQAFQQNFIIEITRIGAEDEEQYNHTVLGLAEQFKISVVATNMCRFNDKAEFETHRIKVCINKKKTVREETEHKYTQQQHLASTTDMIEKFRDIPVAISNSLRIAEACNCHIVLGKSYLPDFPVPAEFTPPNFLRKLASEGLAAKLIHHNITNDKQKEIYYARLEAELKIIISMQYAGYFLIVMDFISWAKSKKIPVGPGRGSGAGSLVAYSTNITEVDPIEHELIFERFLNPERVSLPDFDIDFCVDRRDEVIEYVAKKYGSKRVFQIITFGTMAARAVIRDVGRVFGHQQFLINKIAKLIPNEIGITLTKALQSNHDLAQQYASDDEVKNLIDTSKKLEGMVRNAGKHAGGVIIAASDIENFCPIFCEPNESMAITQLDKNDAEKIGLVKFDFLGLRTLTIIEKTIAMVNEKKVRLKQPKISIENISYDDDKVFNLLTSAETIGVFQLESKGIRRIMQQIQPNCFADIVALIALYRPGPMEAKMHIDFIERKRHATQFTYLHPNLEGILKPTYGVVLYQEQVMQVAREMANYSLAEADALRSAISKKDDAKFGNHKQLFVDRAVATGVDKTNAKEVFAILEKFAGYGFPKSHSTVYAVLCYKTAYLKYYFKAEFLATNMSAEMNTPTRIVELVEECYHQKIKILPPCVNNSLLHFSSPSNNEIRFGFGAIKGLSINAINEIINMRKNNRFQSYGDFITRCGSVLNKKTLETLIFSGACDELQNNRKQAYLEIAHTLSWYELNKYNQTYEQGDVFATTNNDLTTLVLAPHEQMPLVKKIHMEYKVLGFYQSIHPCQIFAKDISSLRPTPLGEIQHNRHKNTNVKVVGLIKKIFRRYDLKNNEFTLVLIQNENYEYVEIEINAPLMQTITTQDNQSFTTQTKLIKTIEMNSLICVNGVIKKSFQDILITAKIVTTLIQAVNNNTKNLHIELVVDKTSDYTTNILRDRVKLLLEELKKHKNKQGVELILKIETPYSSANLVHKSKVYLSDKLINWMADNSFKFTTSVI